MMRGLVQDRALAARYRALALLPEGTLGRAFLAYLEANRFSVPGDRRGFPELVIWHDFGHVLTGYGTDAEGELQMAAFQAGYMKSKPIFMLLFVALTFSAGINVAPLPQRSDHHIFERPGLIERMLHAFELGSKVNVDLSDHWDHWQWIDRPVDEVRTALGIGAAGWSPVTGA
jgi:ubiquinone biosynthesis protein Coq4